MPQFSYKGRDREGRLRVGQRFALTMDSLNADLIREGIAPIKIAPYTVHASFFKKFIDLFQNNAVHMQELAVFTRQMQLLQETGVPLTIALKQLAAHTRSPRLAAALNGMIVQLEKGHSLAASMRQYADTFTPLMINIVEIGETTGHLHEAFGHLHDYISFEANTVKQLRAAFRYPTFIMISIVLSIITLNVFVIPTFAKFYGNMESNLPWQTRILISMSNFTIHYGIYLLLAAILASVGFHFYLKTPKGKYRWHSFLLKIPLFGKLLRRIMLIRLSQSLAIILKSGLSMTQALTLVKNILNNTYIGDQIGKMQEAIERGVPFTQAVTKIELFAPMEIQILGVGEKNGELSPALSYIADFHAREIEFDLKRLNDFIGPVLITAISLMILIVALGVYLPVWNMINLVHS